MGTCPECGAEDVTVYYCDCCGNYACPECGGDVIPHCRGCSTSMEPVDEE